MQTELNPVLVLFPGLGADHRLFRAQRAAFPDLVVPTWPDPEQNDSLSRFAERCAARLPSDRELILGGASFGGMVALEAAALVRPRCVLLIGSCRGPEAIAPRLRRLHPVVKSVPSPLWRPRRWWWHLVEPLFGRLTPGQRVELWAMATGTAAGFLKWGVGAILSWRPSEVAAPVHHIHGGEDQLIPLSRVAPDQVVVDGGHLLPITHPAEVNSFLGKRVGA